MKVHFPRMKIVFQWCWRNRRTIAVGVVACILFAVLATFWTRIKEAIPYRWVPKRSIVVSFSPIEGFFDESGQIFILASAQAEGTIVEILADVLVADFVPCETLKPAGLSSASFEVVRVRFDHSIVGGRVPAAQITIDLVVSDWVKPADDTLFSEGELLGDLILELSYTDRKATRRKELSVPLAFKQVQPSELCVDSQAPRIDIDSKFPHWPADTAPMISWWVEDDCALPSEITLKHRLDNDDWERTDVFGSIGVLELPAGQHVFCLRATDTVGKMTEESLEFIVDAPCQPPNKEAFDIRFGTTVNWRLTEEGSPFWAITGYVCGLRLAPEGWIIVPEIVITGYGDLTPAATFANAFLGLGVSVATDLLHPGSFNITGSLGGGMIRTRSEGYSSSLIAVTSSLGAETDVGSVHYWARLELTVPVRERSTPWFMVVVGVAACQWTYEI